ncbi:hypothetical protein BAZSYMA_ACONTIG03946_3 [Bathymodiolus azoricus thioautotrophic gill symbiont]|uniref:Uncharacterized protein n=1 Tax=Bathymodiolus azoricus thioautotrophic gill symbiont TaxID=235205 RepID=A0A1H6L816_9GAMM|nr:hypothetical protein BAZSYMA_ACONTIG03946_3 [Bathymodiolus azoricus thioautotrophic gill symbiont]
MVDIFPYYLEKMVLTMGCTLHHQVKQQIREEINHER